MTTLHSALTDPELHEPKGAATASAGTVYTSDGAGSGSWDSIPGAVTNVVTIESVTDFPDPVSDVITLAADTTYHISGIVDVGANRFVFQNNTGFMGANPFIDGIVSSTTGNLITANDSSISFDKVRLAAASGTIFSFTGLSTGNALRMESTFIFAATALGTITNAGLFTFRKSFFLPPTTSGFVFAGTTAEGTIKISDSTLYSGSTACAVDLGSATFSAVFIGPNNQFITAVGGQAVCILPNSGNIITGGLGVVHLNSFEGAGTYSTGLDPADLRWHYSQNNGEPDSSKAASCFIEGNATATTFAGVGIGNIVNVDFNAGMSTDQDDQFTVDSEGKMTYDGVEDTVFRAVATVFAEITGGATRQYIYYFAVNGTYVPGTLSKAEYDGSNPGSSTVTGLLTLASGDYVELKVYAVDATTSLTVDTASLSLSQ